MKFTSTTKYKKKNKKQRRKMLNYIGYIVVSSP